MLKTAVPMTVARYLLWYHDRKLRRFHQKLDNARAIQHATLFDKVRRCESSQFGRDHDFRGIRTIEDFRQRVPIAGYEYFEPYVRQVADGNLEAMFPSSDKLLMFTQTSGTTGKPKLIPITRSALREFQRGWQLWGIKAFLDHPSLVLTDILNIVGNCELRRTASGTPVGMASGLCARCQNPFVRRYYAVPSIVAEIADPEAKYYTTLRLAIVRAVGLATTAIAASLVRLAKVGDEHREQLIRDVADGTLSRDFDVSRDIRRSIHRQINRPHRERARDLESVLRRTGTLFPKDYWNLSLLGTWLGGTVGVQSARLAEYYGDVACRDIGIVASEGRFTIPMADGATSGVLDIAGNYYEFIPANEIDSAQPTVLECHELEQDGCYYVLLTTSSGLYRYNLFDVVRCTGFVGTAPTLEFLNKGQHISDLEGEKLTEHQIVQAVADATRRLGLDMELFTVMPRRNHDREPGYVVVIEESVMKNDDMGDQFLSAVDANLSQQNFAYSVRRHDGYLAAPSLVQIPQGSWLRFGSMEIKRRGVGDDHYKHAYLRLDSDFLDQLVQDSSEDSSDTLQRTHQMDESWAPRPAMRTGQPSSQFASNS